MTREDGWFDFMVNGGGAVTLQFGKSPFPPKIETLFAPWNEVCVQNVALQQGPTHTHDCLLNLDIEKNIMVLRLPRNA